MTATRTPAIDRLMKRVDKGGPGGCWIWPGYCSPSGHGRIGDHADDGKHIVSLTHRVVYKALVGPIPEGMEIDHICHVPPCCNPAHLRAVTRKQNQENRVANRNSSTGVRGVSWSAKLGKYMVQVTHNYINHSGGCFETLEEAAAAAVALRNKLHTHNTQDRIARVES